MHHVQRGGSRLGIYFAETGASQRRVHGYLRPRPLGDQRDRSGLGRLGRGAVGRGVVSLDGHHAGARRRRGNMSRAKRSTPRARAGARVSVDLNFRRKLWTEAQAQAVMRPLVTGADLADRQRRGPAVGARRRGRRRGRDGPAQLDRGALPRGGRTASRATSACRAWPSRCARASRPATTAGARVLFDAASGQASRTASATSFAWSIASAPATALRRA